MHNLTGLLIRLNSLFDQFHEIQAGFESDANSAGDSIFLDLVFYKKLHRESHLQAERIQAEMEEYGGMPVWPVAAEELWKHPHHQRHLLQAEFIKHAFQKPNGYAGDKDLMLMICENGKRGGTPYAVLKNQVYQDLPAAEAVRQRIKALRRRLDELPDGSKVLNLACGPAIEVRDYLKLNPHKRIQFDLLDHDIQTTRYTSTNIRDARVRHLIGNAFQIIKGDYRTATPRKLMWNYCSPKSDFRNPSKRWQVPLKYSLGELQLQRYDLVYSAGLYDYIEDVQSNSQRGVRALTKRLFDLLRPGGQLVIGNFLAQSAENPHLMSHRLMMEVYSDWKLIYRSRTEIESFLSALPVDQYSYQYTNEYFDKSNSLPSAIGFLHVTKK